MQLYNTLSRKIERISQTGEQFNMFVCGPTVYDDSHIGHAKTYVQFDVVARILRHAGFKVHYLQNITDIDDKIIRRAVESGITWEQLRDTYDGKYREDMIALNNTSVDTYARATDFIVDIIRQVQTLLEKKHAYATSDGIYYEVSTFAEYGKLSGRKEISAQDALSRIDESGEKRGWNDFCLWKFSKPNEPVWDAPFGKGRPGWHIEDTAISEHFYGSQYDLHGGAIDLIFPHHEAEITQMESISGKTPFVTTWMHSGFLNIQDEKMSKSLGNFLTIRDAILKNNDAMALRLFFLQSHYRSSINFSWNLVDAAQRRLNRWRSVSELRWQNTNGNSDKISLAKHQKSILDALKNDIDTPKALAEIDAVFNMFSSGINHSIREDFSKFLSFLDSILGLRLVEETPDISHAQQQLIMRRNQARESSDFAQADSMRDEAKAQGLTLLDGAYGSQWTRTSWLSDDRTTKD